MRLGLRLVKGLTPTGAERIDKARKQRHFTNLNDLVRRSRLNKKDREALANANALQAFSPHRHQAHWQILGIEPERPLLDKRQQEEDETLTTKALSKPEALSKTEATELIQLPAPSATDDMLADYRSTGLTLGSHPMALLRDYPAFNTCKRYVDLKGLNTNRFVRVAGLVTGRQRPGTASGVVFLTLEDETGNINVIVWKDLQQRFRQALLSSKLLLVKGVMECKNEVIHVIAGELIDHSHVLDELAIKSRDFH